MKIQIASDLHLEFLAPHKHERLMNSFTGDADVLVLAGDIVPLRHVDQIRDSLGPFCERYEHVVYVPGNHEFYKADTREALLILGAVENELSNLHVLKNNECEIKGQKFYGGTMWFQDLPGNGAFKDQLNDFHLIRGFEPWVYEQERQFRHGFKCVKKDHIVVSHHLPTHVSIAERYKDRVPGAPSLNRFFLNNMAAEILDRNPKLWIHGHTHEACDYEVYKTRVICNPRGYPGEGAVNKFNANLIVEV